MIKNIIRVLFGKRKTQLPSMVQTFANSIRASKDYDADILQATLKWASANPSRTTMVTLNRRYYDAYNQHYR